MDIEITDVPALRLAYLRKDMTHPMEAWQELMAIAGPSGVLAHTGVSTLAVFPAEVLEAGPQPTQRYDAALVLPGGVPLPAGLSEDTVPGGDRYARYTYIGPYEGMGGAWGEFCARLAESEHRAASTGVCYEMYRNSPATTDPADLQTDLYIPLAPEE